MCQCEEVGNPRNAPVEVETADGASALTRLETLGTGPPCAVGSMRREGEVQIHRKVDADPRDVEREEDEHRRRKAGLRNEVASIVLHDRGALRFAMRGWQGEDRDACDDLADGEEEAEAEQEAADAIHPCESDE